VNANAKMLRNVMHLMKWDMRSSDRQPIPVWIRQHESYTRHILK
jgi:hypothetical protein